MNWTDFGSRKIAGRIGAIALKSIFAILVLALPLAAQAPGVWTLSGNLNTARAGHAAATLPSGQALIAGGLDSSGNALSSAEIFSLSGNSFTSLPSGLTTAVSGLTATTLKDSTVLLAGGIDSTGASVSAASLYDPSTQTFTALPAMTAARSHHTATLLKDGRVLIAGGSGASGQLASLEIYDPKAQTFSAAGSLQNARQDHTATLLDDSTVLIAGGSNSSGPIASAEIFDPVASAVTATGSLNQARTLAAASELYNFDGTVMIEGGKDASGNDLNSAEVYDPIAGAFTTVTAPMNTARSGHQGLTLPYNGKVLIAGGTSAGAPVAANELYDPITGAFVANEPMSIARDAFAANFFAVPAVGQVLLSGGTDSSGKSLAMSEMFAYPTIRSDQPSYPPGSPVSITGTGWAPGETVATQIQETDSDNTLLTDTADSTGSFTDPNFYIQDTDGGVKFLMTASGQSSGQTAQYKFTDDSVNGVNVTPGNLSVVAGQTSPADTITVVNNTCSGTLAISTTGASPPFLPDGTVVTFSPGGTTTTTSGTTSAVGTFSAGGSTTVTLKVACATTPSSIKYGFSILATGTGGAAGCSGTSRTSGGEQLTVTAAAACATPTATATNTATATATNTATATATNTATATATNTATATPTATATATNTATATATDTATATATNTATATATDTATATATNTATATATDTATATATNTATATATDTATATATDTATATATNTATATATDTATATATDTATATATNTATATATDTATATATNTATATATDTATATATDTATATATNTATATATDTATATATNTATATATDTATATATNTATATPSATPTTVISISFAPLNYNFGPQLFMNTAQTSPAKNFIYNNTHYFDGKVAFSSITASPSANFQIVTDGCSGPGLPAPLSTCQVTVTFTPTGQGVFNGTLTAVDNASNSPQVINLTGTGVGGKLTLSSPSFAFGNVGVGTQSAAKSLTLTNNNAIAMHITSIAGTSDYLIQNDTCSGTDLAASGGSCSVGVVFAPTTTGAHNESLTLTDNGAGSPQSVPVTGTGVISPAAVSPKQLIFSNQAQATTSADKTLTLTNNNTVALNFSTDSVSGDFAIDTDTCAGQTIAANGGTCTIAISFTPTTTGSRTGTLTINNNSTSSPQLVSLSGTGVLLSPTFSPKPLAFGGTNVGVPVVRTTTATNPNAVGLSFTSAVASSGTNDYSVTGDTCSGNTIGAGLTCQIQVTLNPTIMGTDNGTLTVTTNASTPTSTVSLTGHTPP